MRKLSFVDHIIGQFDQAARTLGSQPRAQRPYPASPLPQDILSAPERVQVEQLLRVDHAGEVAAQALYHGQAFTARRTRVRAALLQAAQEENDHLAWTAQRLQELGGHTSRLGAVWYAGSFFIGAATGLLGDKWNLGFLAETENQVVAHLEQHLKQLPPTDAKSEAVIRQMLFDEQRHATDALRAGGVSLPYPFRQLMRFTARIMTSTAKWI